MENIDVAAVLQFIRPGAEWVLVGTDYSGLEWRDKTTRKPTPEELVAGAAVLAALAYRQRRAAEYPPVGDQLDALWEGGQAAAEMKARLNAIKAKHPKPAGSARQE